MPTYDYRCRVCEHVTSRVFTMAETPKTVDCEDCAEEASKIISQVSVKLSNASKMDRLDPKYDKLVDKAMGSTTSADPDNYLKKMRPFSQGKD
jgi:putative FmdB family regulatory protein